MGEPRKKRKQYETPRKQWDKVLLGKERKLVDFYGLKNKKELRKLETWLKYKRKTAKGLLALPLEKRMQRQAELMSGLGKIGLVKAEASLDDVLGLRIEELLEKRLQTVVLRKGLANTSKQARQFVVHGHIAINGKKVDAPGYMVRVEEVSAVNWYGEPVKFETSEPKKDLKKEFEESAGLETLGEGTEMKEGNAEIKGEQEPAGLNAASMEEPKQGNSGQGGNAKTGGGG